MSIAPWRVPLSRALHRNRSLPYARYFQLATVYPDGYPANRTVVFRGFFDNYLKIITDSRSQKVNQINHNPGAEICWYFPKTREQFRLRGQLILVGEDYPELTLKKERQITWQGLSDAARVQFAWSNPGEPRVESDPAFSQPPPDPEQPLPNFCLLLLEPIQVDHLELRGDPQNRSRYTQECDRQWIKQAINP
ncbi:MAG: pyridoxamine 5'-phosphate oxidase family protein [Coleofasciculus chthonoplastes F3-SA18-01]|uniref:Npun_F5749 family FMN-dependent PPOX-type flavoprotein n=1 Tax=Coleofasciculus chthonoplastes TaxID=64178 RepID=UPI0032F30F74